jgi:hypothetical protein
MKRLLGALLFASLASLWTPSVASAATLYYIDEFDRTAVPQTLLGVSFYGAFGGTWRLIDGQTFQLNNGANLSVRSLPDGVSLVSISSTTATTMYARGSDGILYYIDEFDRTAIPQSVLDVKTYTATTGIWRLIDGQTFQLNNGANLSVRSLPDGVSLVSISSTTATTMYARGSDGILYYMDEFDRVAIPQSLLDVNFYAATTNGVWQLLDGDTLAESPGYFPASVRSLPDGVALTSIASANSSTIYAYGTTAVPEPSTWAIGVVCLSGLSVLAHRRRRA